MNAIPAPRPREHGWNDSKPNGACDTFGTVGAVGTVSELAASLALGIAWTHARGDTNDARLADWHATADALGLGGRP